MDWTSIYKLYPVNRNMIWLNNCGTTPSGEHINREVASFLTSYSENGILTTDYPYFRVLKDIQNFVSGLINCRPDDIAPVRNTAEGMNLISHGLDLQPGSEIILLENEYPSNVYPWEHLQKKGVKISFAPMTESPEEFYKEFEKKITGSTVLVSLSAVHWCTGMPLPLKKVAATCRERSILFVVDAAQGAGHVPIDMGELDCIMVFSAWKWLMGPLGMGILAVPEKKLKMLDPVFKGTGSVVNEMEYLPYKNQIKPTAERYIYSTPGIIDWIYFRESLRLLNSVGMEKIMERIYFLADLTADMLRRRGFTLACDSFNEKTGIVAAEIDGHDSAMLVKELKKRKIIAAERLGRIRFSPHIYNSPEQVERVGEVLDEIIG